MFKDLYEHLILEDKPDPESLFKSASAEERLNRLPPLAKKVQEDLGLSLDPDSWSRADIVFGKKEFTYRELDAYFQGLGYKPENNKEGAIRTWCWFKENYKDQAVYYKQTHTLAMNFSDEVQESSKPNPDDIFKSATPKELISRFPEEIQYLHKLFGGKPRWSTFGNDIASLVGVKVGSVENFIAAAEKIQYLNYLTKGVFLSANPICIKKVRGDENEVLIRELLFFPRSKSSSHLWSETIILRERHIAAFYWENFFVPKKVKESSKPNPDDIFKSATPEEVHERLPEVIKKLERDLGLEYDPKRQGNYDFYFKPKRMSFQELDTYFRKFGLVSRPMYSHGGFWNWENREGAIVFIYQKFVGYLAGMSWAELKESSKPNPDDIFKSATPEEMEDRMPPLLKKIREIFNGTFIPERCFVQVKRLSPEEFLAGMKGLGFSATEDWPTERYGSYVVADRRGGRVHMSASGNYIYLSECYPPIFESSKPNPDDIFKSITNKEFYARWGINWDIVSDLHEAFKPWISPWDRGQPPHIDGTLKSEKIWVSDLSLEKFHEIMQHLPGGWKFDNAFTYWRRGKPEDKAKRIWVMLLKGYLVIKSQ